MSDISAKEFLIIGIQFFQDKKFAEAVPYLEQAKNMGEESACLSLVGCYLIGEGEELYTNLAKAKENFDNFVEFCRKTQSCYDESKEHIEKLKATIEKADKDLEESVFLYEQFRELREGILDELQLELLQRIFNIQPDRDIIKEFLKNGGDLGLLCNPIKYTKQYPEVLIEVAVHILCEIVKEENIQTLLENFDDNLEILLPDYLQEIVAKDKKIYNGIFGQLTQKWVEQNPEPKEESESKFADAAAAAPATSSSTSAAAIAAAAEPSASDSSDITDKDLEKTAKSLFSYVVFNRASFGLDKSTSVKTSGKNFRERFAALEQQEEERVQRTMRVYDYLLSNLTEVMQRYESQTRPNAASKVINKILAENGTVQNEDLLDKLKEKIRSKKTEAEQAQQRRSQGQAR